VINPNVRDLAISPGFASDQTLYAATDGGGIYKSANGGESWSEANAGLSFPYINRLAFSPDYITTGTMYAAFTQVYVSNDHGATWSNLGTIGWGRYVVALTLTPGEIPTVFAGTDGESLWRYRKMSVYLPLVIR
jgi:photosystem II stability/assembly factor-like uncharacterized protein